MLFLFSMLIGCAKTAQLRIETNPAQSVVLLNGLPICYEMPCEKTLAPGEYRLDVRAERFQSFSKALTLRGDQVVTVALQPKGGWISVETEPAHMQLLVDQKMLGHAPLYDKPLPAGTHTLSVRSACYRDVDRELVVKEGERSSIQLTMEPLVAELAVDAHAQSGEAVAANIVLEGRSYGVTPQTIVVPLCARELIVHHQDTQAAIELSLEKDRVNRVDLTLAPFSESSDGEGLLGFIPPVCRKDGIDVRQCVASWFLKKKQEAEERNQEHFHHEGCSH